MFYSWLSSAWFQAFIATKLYLSMQLCKNSVVREVFETFKFSKKFIQYCILRKWSEKTRFSTVKSIMYDIFDACITFWYNVVFCKVCSMFRRSATHCISPQAAVVCVCVSVCVSVCLCVCRVCGRQENGSDRRHFFKVRGMAPNITCECFKQIGVQIPRWRTK